MYVNLHALVAQAMAGADQADGARLVYRGKSAQIEADAADRHGTKVCPALVKQLGAPAVELADQADSDAALVACPLVSDQKAAAGAAVAVARHAQLQSAQMAGSAAGLTTAGTTDHCPERGNTNTACLRERHIRGSGVSGPANVHPGQEQIEDASVAG